MDSNVQLKRRKVIVKTIMLAALSVVCFMTACSPVPSTSDSSLKAALNKKFALHPGVIMTPYGIV